MSIRTVRLDPEYDLLLEEIQGMTGISTSTAFKRGLTALRDSLRQEGHGTPFDVYAGLDIGPGGQARAPARKAKPALAEILRQKHRR